MRKSALVLLTVLAIQGCQSSGLAPIEIDLSKRTLVATPTPTPVPTLSPAAAMQPVAAPPASPPIPEPAAAVLSAPALTGEGSLKPEGVIDAQLAAYNRHDVDAFVRCYAADAVFFDFPDRVRLRGSEQIRQAYKKEFAESAASQAAVSSRIPQGNFVIDHETVSGAPGHEVASRVVIYEVQDGKIRRVWFLR